MRQDFVHDMQVKLKYSQKKTNWMFLDVLKKKTEYSGIYVETPK